VKGQVIEFPLFNDLKNREYRFRVSLSSLFTVKEEIGNITKGEGKGANRLIGRGVKP